MRQRKVKVTRYKERRIEGNIKYRIKRLSKVTKRKRGR